MRQGIVTVVGGTGFLGRYVVRALAREGYVIRVLSRNPLAGTELKTYGDVGQIVLEYADLAKPHTLDGKLEHANAVVNLVGVLYERGQQNFSTLHAQGAEKLAQMAKAAGVERYVHISALGVETALDSKYARTKLLGERATCSALPQTTVLRPSVLFGSEDNFFNQFARMACLSPVLPLIGGGKTRFQPVYVADVAAVVAQALKHDAMPGKTFELGGPEIMSFKQVLAYICKTTGRNPALINIPFRIAAAMGSVAEMSPCTPPLTRDQVRLLKYDNVVGGQALTFSHLKISPTAVDTVVPHYLCRFIKRSAGEAAA